MRPTLLIFVALSVASAQASWFASENPAYESWSKPELQAWLKEHNINAPSSYSTSQLQGLVKSNWDAFATAVPAWSYDQYTKAQKSFQDLKDASFESWDESRLREFLLEQGVVAPSGPREQLVLLAKQKYAGYNAAASSFSAEASKTAGGYASSASSAAATATSAIAQATRDAARALDDSRDYVYSSWDESQLRKYLEDKGVVDKKTASGLSREQLLAQMRTGYASVTEPVWDAWSDSYLREWLLTHNIISPTYDAKRAGLLEKMKHYYYTTNDTVYSTWTDTQLRQWLIDNNYIKSDQQVNREKALALVKDNYASASGTVWGAWSDSDIRAWLIENGYMKSDAQAKRDELVKAINDKYTDVSARTAAYLAWPDARLRAYLRERGISEAALPTSRPGLLQETRIRWVQTTTRADNLYAKIAELINTGVHSAEDSLHQIYELLVGSADAGKAYADKKAAQGKAYAGEKAAEGKAYAGEKAAEGKAYADEKAAHGKAYADEKAYDARQAAGEKVKQGGAKLKGEL
ncbi:hypothetical protein HWV62_19349 [Athelia sp. TMB]|nr:hypothetical protein HWV62_19349 [Athelia sp. TMB]